MISQSALKCKRRRDCFLPATSYIYNHVAVYAQYAVHGCGYVHACILVRAQLRAILPSLTLPPPLPPPTAPNIALCVCCSV